MKASVVICKRCGKETKNQKFCSKSCRAKYCNPRRKPRTAESKEKYRASIKEFYRKKRLLLPKRYCLRCGKQIEKPQGQYCDSVCYHSSRRGSTRPSFSEEWKAKIKLAKAKQAPISEEGRRKISLAHKGRISPNKGNTYSEETKKRMSVAGSGKGNHNWRGGLSCEPYSPEFNRELKEHIRKRDRYCCKICKGKQRGKAFPVHHIDYDKKNCSKLNLITLCNCCHGKTNFNRRSWVPRLNGKIVQTYLGWC